MARHSRDEYALHRSVKQDRFTYTLEDRQGNIYTAERDADKATMHAAMTCEDTRKPLVLMRRVLH